MSIQKCENSKYTKFIFLTHNSKNLILGPTITLKPKFLVRSSFVPNWNSGKFQVKSWHFIYITYINSYINHHMN